MQVKRPKRPIHGVLLLDKPLGLSSNHAMQRVKNLYQAEKAGHTGSLDPLATGLLPICLGEATKFAHFLLDADKSYLATVKLGIKTTTADAEGEVIQQRPVDITQTDLQQVLQAFTGAIQQTPPIYSALKVDGKPLYAYARAGQSVEISARQVHIHGLQLQQLHEDTFTIEVVCSKGTYIRSLAQDIGDKLGCGAHLIGLRRTRSGLFDLQHSFTLEQLLPLDLPMLDQKILAIDVLVQHLSPLTLDSQQTHAIQHGQSITLDKEIKSNEIIRLYDMAGQFIGLAEHLAEGKVFPKRLVRQNAELSNGIT